MWLFKQLYTLDPEQCVPSQRRIDKLAKVTPAGDLHAAPSLKNPDEKRTSGNPDEKHTLGNPDEKRTLGNARRRLTAADFEERGNLMDYEDEEGEPTRCLAASLNPKNHRSVVHRGLPELPPPEPQTLSPEP